jgi:DNA-binding PadR family transcriptional regulator
MRGFNWLGGSDRHHHHHDHHEREAAGGRGRGGGGRHGGGPFGWGGPPFGGPPGAFARMFGRGRRARRGDVRGAILLVLVDEPRNGYQIMQELAQRSGGTWRPSSGSVYPTLQQLEDEGLIDGATREDVAAGKVYKLTASGKRYVEKNRAELEAAWQDSGDPSNDPRFEMMDLFRQVGSALMEVLQAGSPSQVVEAKKLLQELRRTLYSMLAATPTDDDADV